MSAATERTPLLTGHDHSRTDDNPSQQPQQTVLDGLDANILETGLTQQEADSRLKCDGPNEISDSNETPFLLLLRKFTGPTAYMLELTILVALLPWLRKYDVAVVVTILLLLNVFLAFSQEQKALRALDELKECLQLKCRVLRDGCWHHDLPARDLVKGDIVRLRLGDYVPADVVIVQGHVQVDNSALTGESVAVDAPKTSPVYAGARIITGEATALVTGTGASTFYGRTTQLIQLSHPKSHIDTIVKKVTLALVILLVVLLGLAGVILVREAGTEGLVDVLPLMLLLLASGVPVALPAMFTTATALGSLELARKGVLITRLNATEDAARMTILESDKTGTLTQNRLSVSSVHPYATDIHPCDVVYLGAIASLEANKDPIDLAFLEFAEGERGDVEGGEMGEDGEDGGEGSDDHAVALDVESGLTALQCGEAIIECPLKLDLQTLRQTLDVVKFLPFDPALRRWTGVILHRPPAPSASLTPSAPQKRSPKSDFPQQPTLSEYHLVVKGSVAEVSSLCGVAMDEYAEIEEVVERWAARGWRSLAVAATFDPHAMTDAGSSEGIAPTQTESDQHFQSASEVLQSSSVSAAPHILDHLSRSRLFLLGLVALMDPPRRDSKKVVAELNGLGVKVQMLTGDSLSIAKEIGADVGLNPEKMITMTEFHEMKRRRTERGEGRRERMESTALLSRAVERERGVEGWKVADMDGFAEILPEDKHTVVETLQKSGHVVGMTGDGVNDAPALKLAEVGIAMSNATDIAKGSASAILLHEGLSGVLSLVMVGRKIHQRIVTWVLNKIVKTFQSNVYIIVAFLVKGVFVVDAIHLLVLLFCVDFLTLSLAKDPVPFFTRGRRPHIHSHPRHHHSISSMRRPQRWDIPKLAICGGLIGTLCVLESLAFFAFSFPYVVEVDVGTSKSSSTSPFSMNANPNDAIPSFSTLPQLEGGLPAFQSLNLQLLYAFAAATVISVRERSWWFRSRTSIYMAGSIVVCAIFLLVLVSVGLGTWITPVPVVWSLVAFGYASVCGLVVNDPAKVGIFKVMGM